MTLDHMARGAGFFIPTLRPEEAIAEAIELSRISGIALRPVIGLYEGRYGVMFIKE